MDIIVIILCLIALGLSGFFLLGKYLDNPPPLQEEFSRLPVQTLGSLEPWDYFELGWPNNGGVIFTVARLSEALGTDMVPIVGPGINYYELHRSTPVAPLKPIS